ncbi:hypothetical protein E1B28_011524 [Marasmius oreades]|uniref:Uncharacterized protein n=1 Tax=Marasmius oreades TaxID=181124 RepID=A0A9P7RV17_9AGAR|nr:uncharacterized protein E1B28_011524 [Marasmius oreades]KAG7089890.1 hypothetical protein E1B28_011524 [Marasmius oreades]
MSQSRPLPIPPQHPGEQVDCRLQTPPPVYLVDGLRTPSTRPLPLPPVIQQAENTSVVMPAEESPPPPPISQAPSNHLVHLVKKIFNHLMLQGPSKLPRWAQLLFRSTFLAGFFYLLYQLDQSSFSRWRSASSGEEMRIVLWLMEVIFLAMFPATAWACHREFEVGKHLTSFISVSVFIISGTIFSPGASKWQEAAEGFVQIGFLLFLFTIAMVWKKAYIPLNPLFQLPQRNRRNHESEERIEMSPRRRATLQE